MTAQLVDDQPTILPSALGGATTSMVGELRRATPPEHVQWRGNMTTRDKSRISVLGYVDARYVMDLLDEVVLPENWQTRYEDIAGGYRCGIGILVNGEWVWKYDAHGQTDVEPIKGGHSKALVRAAVHWGIGRDLYELPDLWVTARETYAGSGKYEPAVLPHFNGEAWVTNAPPSGNGRAVPSPARPSAAPDDPYADLPNEWETNGKPTAQDHDGTCPDHDLAWVLQPGGISKTTNKPYDPFWKCPSDERPYCRNKPSKPWQARHEG